MEWTLDATLAQEADLIEAAQQLSRGGPPSLPGYQLNDRLGAGSFGEAWAGVQISTGQKVAVKIFTRSQALNWTAFRGEVDRLIQVAEHPNVVTLLDANLEHDPPFFVMPLMAGPMEECQNEAVVLEWMEQVAQGLSYIHSRGILHGDLKPANVLLDSQGRARLADFGQSFAAKDGGYNLGTLGYMAPEQIARALDRGHFNPDERWDIYAYGATFYRILSGQLPRLDRQSQTFMGSLSMSERLQHCLHLTNSPLAPLKTLVPKLHRDLAAIIECCLDPLTEFRYRNAEEILADIRRFREGLPLEARRPWSRFYLFERFARRNPGATGGTLLVMALLMGGAWLGWSEVRRQQAIVETTATQLTAMEESRHKLDKEIAHHDERTARDLAHVAAVAVKQGDWVSASLWWARAYELTGKPLYSRLAQCLPYSLEAYRKGWPGCGELQVHASGTLAGRQSADTIFVWPLQQNRQSYTLPGGVCSWTWNGTLRAGSNEGLVRTWTSKGFTDELLHSPLALLDWDRSSMVTAIAPNAVASDGFVVWNGRRYDFPGVVQDLRLSGDGRALLALGADGLARLYPGAAVFSGLRRAELRADGRQVLGLGLDGQALLFNSAGQRIGSAGPAETVAFDGQRALAAGERLWELPGARSVARINDEPLAFSPDGTTLATFANGQLSIRETSSGAPLSGWLPLDKQPREVKFSKDNRWLAVLDDNLRLYKRRSVGWVAVEGSPETKSPKEHVVKSRGNTAQVYFTAETPLPVGPPLEHPRPVLDQAVSPGGQLVATRDDRGQVRIWLADAGVELALPDAPNGAGALQVQNDGTVWVGSRGWRLKAEELDGKELLQWVEHSTGRGIGQGVLSIHRRPPEEWK